MRLPPTNNTVHSGKYNVAIWNNLRRRWEDEHGKLTRCPSWAKGSKEYKALELHEDDKPPSSHAELEQETKRKSTPKPGPEEDIAELAKCGYVKNPGTEFSSTPWEAIDKAKWPNVRWFYFTFYHSGSYYQDSKFETKFSYKNSYGPYTYSGDEG